MKITGLNMICLGVQGVFFFILVILIEYKFFCKSRVSVMTSESPQLEMDVETEKNTVLLGGLAVALPNIIYYVVTIAITSVCLLSVSFAAYGILVHTYITVTPPLSGGAYIYIHV